MEERTVFVDTLFDILSSTNAQSFGQDFVKNLREHPMEFLSSFQNVDKASWLKISRVIGAFLDSAVQNGFAMSPVSRLMESIQSRRGKKETAYKSPVGQCSDRRFVYSTVTLFARFLGLSTFSPLETLM